MSEFDADGTGRAGDVVLWHPGLLHAGSPNCADEPRLMFTSTAYSEGFHVDSR